MGSDADPIITAGVAPIHFARPACAVKGYFPPKPGQTFGAMCGQSGLGGRSCHFTGECEHQRAQEAKQGEQENG